MSINFLVTGNFTYNCSYPLSSSISFAIFRFMYVQHRLSSPFPRLNFFCYEYVRWSSANLVSSSHVAYSSAFKPVFRVHVFVLLKKTKSPSPITEKTLLKNTVTKPSG